MVKQPQEKQDAKRENNLDDNVTLFNHPVDDEAFHSDHVLTAALKQGKSVFQIKDLLKPNSKITVGAVATPFSSSKDRTNLQNCLIPQIPHKNFDD